MKSEVWKSAMGRASVHARYEELLSQWTGGITRKEVSSPLGPTAVLECGRPDGPPVILLHGSMSTSLTWMGDAPRWGEYRRILAVDLPGEPGFSQARRPALTSNEPEMWLDAVLSGLKLEKTAIVGMSLGGWFGLRYASRFPERVSAIACIVPGGIAPQRPDFLPRVIWYALQGRRGAEKIRRLVNHKVVLPREAQEFGDLVQKHFKPLTEVLPVFSDEEIRRLTMPLYYAAGDRDSLLDTRSSSERLRRLLPHATIKVLEDVGHVVLDRGPDIDRFLP